jgi:hypothetical protein
MEQPFLGSFRCTVFVSKSLHFLSYTGNKKCIDLFLMELLGLIDRMELMEHLELISQNNNLKEKYQ